MMAQTQMRKEEGGRVAGMGGKISWMIHYKCGLF